MTRPLVRRHSGEGAATSAQLGGLWSEITMKLSILMKPSIPTRSTAYEAQSLDLRRRGREAAAASPPSPRHPRRGLRCRCPDPFPRRHNRGAPEPRSAWPWPRRSPSAAPTAAPTCSDTKAASEGLLLFHMKAEVPLLLACG